LAFFNIIPFLIACTFCFDILIFFAWRDIILLGMGYMAYIR